jgi:hypothetical protein
MTLRKSLLLIVSLFLIAGFTQAKVKDGIYQIPKTTVAPVIDGVQDDIWKTVDWNFQRIFTVDGTPCEDSAMHLGMSKALWDDDNLYILFYSEDPIICDNPSQTDNYQKDAVEIYIDGDNSKIPDNVSPDPGGGLAPGDLQTTVPHAYMGEEDSHLANIGFPADGSIPTDGVVFRIVEDDALATDTTAGLGGWWLEMKIPLDNLNIPAVAGTEIGWELQQDISDDFTARQWMTKWWSNSNNSWTDASIWGTAVLSDRTTNGTLEIKKTDVSISIDGVMDAAYQGANPATMNIFRVDNSGNIENLMFDNFAIVYPLYDDNNFYAFFNITDDDIEDNPSHTAAGENYQKDSEELYIDGDDSKTPGSVPSSDLHATFPHAYMDVEIDNIANLGFPSDGTIPTDGVEFKITENDYGWNLEVKIPLDNLNIPAVEGTAIGFELQNNESDADDAGNRGAMEKWWNKTNNSWADASIWGEAYLGSLAVVGVKEKPSTVVTRYDLSQNYPNPFNPATKISFSVPKSGFVTLKVYNLLGQLISTVLSKELNTGSYEADFNAANLPSGIYFYKLEAGNTVLTKKMMLLK